MNAEKAAKKGKGKLTKALSFCDGTIQWKHSNIKYQSISGKCKSVEFLSRRDDTACILDGNLSQSANCFSKPCFSKMTFNKSSAEADNSDGHPEECACKCNQATMLNSSTTHNMQDTKTMQYGDGVPNRGLGSVKLQHLNGQVLPDFSADNEGVFIAMQQQHRALTLAYETSQSSDSIICRICHSAGDEKLIAPCKCSGSTRYVHEPCLVTWFKKSVKNECELCRSEVKIKKINHSLLSWRKPEDRPIPLIWFFVFFIGLFLNILSIYVNASERCKSTACLIFYIVNGFGIILDSAFLYFWFLKCQHYCKKWFALNQDWFIDDLETTPVQYVRNETHAV